MKLKIFFSAFILLLISTVNVYAQISLPCGGDDIDNPCPLDTWVIVLAIAVSLFAALRLYRRKNSIV